MLRQKAIFKDGFEVSIQASYTHYCSPREDDSVYYEVECGFPNKVEPLLMPYAEESSKPCDTVYGYVPASVIRELMEKHGGLVSGSIPPLC